MPKGKKGSYKYSFFEDVSKDMAIGKKYNGQDQSQAARNARKKLRDAKKRAAEKKKK